MKRALLVLPMLLLLAPPLAAASGELVWDGFESGATQWNTADEFGLVQAAISRDVASEGSYSFGGRVEVPSLAKKPHAGFYLQPEADFRQISSFHFDLFNGTKDSWEVKIVFQTGPSWDWNETAAFTLAPGWNRNLGVDDFKTYVFPSSGKILSHADDVVKINILVTPKVPTQGALYLDNVRVSGPGAAALVPKRLAGAKERLVDSYENPTSEFKPIYGAGVRTEPDPDHATRGKQGLRLVAVCKDPDQNAIFAYEKDVDLSGVQSVLVDVYNPGPPAMIAFSEAFGANWGYAESPGVRLRTGWNPNVAFDLQARNFKSESSTWKNNGGLPSFLARRVGFTWSPGDTGKVSITIDNLRFRAVDDVAAKALAPPPPVPGWETPLWGGPGAAPNPRDDYSSARAATFSQAYLIEGQPSSLRLQWKATGANDAGDFEWKEIPDLRGVEGLRMDIYNDSAAPADLAIAVKAGPAQTWMESRPVHLAPGWNEGLELPLDGPVFKSANTAWAYTASLPGRAASDLSDVCWHLVPTAAGTGALYIARASMWRSSLPPGSGVPAAVVGSASVGVRMEPYAWTTWDSGAGEGTFEKGLSAWTGENGGGFDASTVAIGTAGASQGKNALRITMAGSGTNKAGAAYDPSTGAGPAIPDLSATHRVRLDVYNPGRPLALNMAFSVGGAASSDWVQSVAVPLASGWNHDVTFDLDAAAWTVVQTGTGVGGSGANAASLNVPGATALFTSFPSSWRAAGQITKLYLLFQSAIAGTVWVDNIRFGKDGSTVDELASADVALQGAVGPLELKASLKAGQSTDGNTWVQPGAAHAVVRYAGQSLGLSFGEAAPAFDDVIGVYTGREGITTGLGAFSRLPIDQVSALHWEGGLPGLQAQAFGALPWGPAPYSFDGDAIGGVRVKAMGPTGTWIGGTWLKQRFGYDPGADILGGAVQQDSQVLEIDGQTVLPWNLTLRAGWGRTDWADAPENILLHNNLGQPVLYERPLTSTANALRLDGSWNSTLLKLNVDYADADAAFDNSLTDNLFDAQQFDGKATFEACQLDFIRLAAEDPGVVKGLLRGFAITGEYRSYLAADDSYGSGDVVGRLENSREERLGYIVYVDSKTEQKTSLSNTLDPADNGPLEPSDSILDMRAIVRIRPFESTNVVLVGKMQQFTLDGYGGAANTTGSESAFGAQISQRLGQHHSLALSAGSFTYLQGLNGTVGAAGAGLAGESVPSSFGLEAGIHSQWLEGLTTDLGYGRAPFTGELMDTAWWSPDPTATLHADWSF